LAKFDGRRTQTINDPALPSGRILALQTDQQGAMWIGTETGAARFHGGEFLKINETANQTVSAIITPEPNLALMTTEQGRIYESRARQVTEVTSRGITDSETTTATRTVIDTRELLNQPLESAEREQAGRPLTITSISFTNNRIFIGTLSRGVLEIANGAVKEPQTRPPVYFINALAQDKDGKL